MNTPRVLLTGASGFVGRHTIAPLLGLGYEVHAVGGTVTDARARWYRADLMDQSTRRQLVASVRPTAMLHCAWITQRGVYWHAAANLDWVAASLDLSRLAVEFGATRLLMAGSCAEYDWQAPPARPWREDDPCQPESLYGTAKHTLHQIVARFARDIGVGVVWARLFHLYGPGEAADRLVPSLVSALLEGRQAATGPGDAVRDFMHVADAGRALAQLLAGDLGGAVNVASGRPVSVAALAGMLARIAGRPDLLALGTRPAHGPMTIAADVTRLRMTGFADRIALRDGLAALWTAAGGTVQPTPAPDYDEAARLFRAGQTAEARGLVEAILARSPDHVGAINLLGVLHRQHGSLIAARTLLQRAASLDPRSDIAWINLGNVHLDLESADDAVDAYTQALAAAPAKRDTQRLLASALARVGRDAEAMERFDQAVAQTPGSATLLRDRAHAHFIAKRMEAALADIDAALGLRPEELDLLLIKAQMLRYCGRGADAVALLTALVERAPQNADVHLALADAWLADERRDRANHHYQRAVALRPDDEQAQGKLCWSLLNTRYGNEAAHVAEAAAIARRMVARGVLQPANAHAVQSALLRIADLDAMAAFDALFPDRRVLLDYWVRRNVIGALHAQLARVTTLQDRVELIGCHRAWGARYEAKTEPLRTRRAPPGARIRIGFMSSDLRHHPVSYFAQPIFDHYDRERFELFAYAFNPGEPDAVQRHIAQQVSEFRHLRNMPEQDIANRIAQDRLDILFELGGSTHLNRLEVMAHQPAPVQVSWLGYPHSSGLSRIGYILVDPYLRPPDERLLLERPFEMPESWVSLGPLGFADQPIHPGLPEERAGCLTFGTMNNPYKYAPATIALWARVLRGVPGSRFLIVRPEAGVAAFRECMARAFGRHGVTPERIAYSAVRGRHMEHYNDIDIALDTAPQTGGTTTCESLWMGVPTISLVGPAFFERLSYSNLVNAGLRDLTAATPDLYVAAALALAADPARRRGLRRDLRETIRRSPLGDTRRWVRDFEQRTIATLTAA